MLHFTHQHLAHSVRCTPHIKLQCILCAARHTPTSCACTEQKDPHLLGLAQDGQVHSTTACGFLLLGALISSSSDHCCSSVVGAVITDDAQTFTDMLIGVGRKWAVLCCGQTSSMWLESLQIWHLMRMVEGLPDSVLDRWLMFVCMCSWDSHWLAVLPSGDAAPQGRPPLDMGRSPEYSSMTLCR